MTSFSAPAATHEDGGLTSVGDLAGAGLAALAVLLFLNGVADAFLKAEIKRVWLKEWLGLVSASAKIIAAVATYVWVALAKNPLNSFTLWAVALSGVAVVVVTAVIALFSAGTIRKKTETAASDETTADARSKDELEAIIERAVRAALNGQPTPAGGMGPAPTGPADTGAADAPAGDHDGENAPVNPHL